MAICVEHALLAREGAHQHEQRGLRQMEIGEQRTHHPELMAGIDKNIGLAAPCLYPSRLRGGIFQCPDRGGSDRYDPPSGIQSAIDRRQPLPGRWSTTSRCNL